MSLEFVTRFVPDLSKEARKIVESTGPLYEYATRTNNPEHITKLLSHPDDLVRSLLTNNPNYTSHHIDKGLDDSEFFVRENAIRNPNATERNIDKALNDSNLYVRALAIMNPNSNERHLDIGINDPKRYVVESVARNLKAKKEHIVKALAHEDEFVRLAAIKNPRYQEYFPNGH